MQLELTTALRKSLFVNEKLSAKSRINRSNWSPAMYRFQMPLIKRYNKLMIQEKIDKVRLYERILNTKIKIVEIKISESQCFSEISL